MVEQARDERKQQAMDALRRLARRREGIERRSGVYQGDLIAEARIERDDQIGRVWSGGER